MLSLGQIAAAWNAFFYEPEPVATLALFRIAFGLFCVLNGLLLTGHCEAFWGRHGIFPLRGYDQVFGRNRLCLFNVLPPSDRTPAILLWIHIVASLSLTFGCCTRFSAFVAWMTILSLHHRNPSVLMGADNLQRFILFLLTFSHAGAGLSVDSLWQGRSLVESISGVRHSPWCTRLIQCQIALLYWQSFIWKMSGETWRRGVAVYYVLHNRMYRRITFPPWMMTRAAIAGLTYGALAIEAALGTLIWVDEFRDWVIVAGWALHLGIEFTMNVHLFEWLMCVCIFLFVRPELTERLMVSVLS